MGIVFSDEYLGSLWDAIDWETAKEKLAAMQADLTIAAFRKDAKVIQELQKSIVRDIDIKCLAVRHVVQSRSGLSLIHI